MGLFSWLVPPDPRREQLVRMIDWACDPYKQLMDFCHIWNQHPGSKGAKAWPSKEDDGNLKVHLYVFHPRGGRATETVELGNVFDLTDVSKKLHDAQKRLLLKVSPFPPELVQIPGR